ncbi:MAG: sterol desaturase family protein [Bdellovibrionaceae bacterium]|nr:sterol desaturase family protein [Pseudobdellovibrionaceae bacterium]MDW8190106.1 sterol desaturase family protein [Pseudobdellovibrionaceae bacterium]
MNRLLHLKWWMRTIHFVHHMSRPPSPWSSFSFHPAESILNALALPLILLMLPVPLPVFLFHLIFMSVTAVTNHLGGEVIPPFLVKRGILKVFISGLHHGYHHRDYEVNYGLFFTFWDRLMNTNKMTG